MSTTMNHNLTCPFVSLILEKIPKHTMSYVSYISKYISVHIV